MVDRMVDMSVRIGNVTLKNPIMPASGAFSTELAQVMDVNRLGLAPWLFDRQNSGYAGPATPTDPEPAPYGPATAFPYALCWQC